MLNNEKNEFIKLYSKKYNINEEEAEKQIQKFLQVMKIALLENREVVFKNFYPFKINKRK